MQRHTVLALGYSWCSYLELADTPILLSYTSYSAAYNQVIVHALDELPHHVPSGWVWIIISGEE